ncbi:MobP3 family relaxase [Paenibacillus chitinolyticus]|uniref:MobP3 family relaxase n=1 Tax=Paenibacillus chitinolyticus TaxID=79263 RepID=UPI001C43E2F6|nr:MobP3 family relaxase [Paenibacillus chitinolyticus]MBV6717198.1 relaxase MobL [Paenibacillus chitinolyticus]
MSYKNLDSPFFMNLYFYQPSPENTEKNISHIAYIGKRPGVVMETEKKLDDVNQDYETDSWDFKREPIGGKEGLPSFSDFVKYLEDEELGNQRKQQNEKLEPNSAAHHVKYAHERPRSHGLFSTNDVEDLKGIQDELKTHKGMVWRGILSLKESDAIRLGYDEREAWEDMMRTTVPLMANEMGIPERNLKWVAAFHQEQGHPHVHLVMWEKEPKRKRGVLTAPETREVKKIFVNEIYGEERLRLTQEKTAERDLLRQLAKMDLVKSVELIRDVRAEQKQVELEMKAAGAVRSVGVPPKLYKEDNNELAQQISELAEIMPKRGRLSYKFMPENVKLKADEVSKWLLQQPAQREPLEHYLKTVEMMTRHYTFQPEQIKAAQDKAYLDIQKRVSQVVLKAASESQKNVFQNVIPERAQAVIEQFAQATGAPEDTTQIVLHNTAHHFRLFGFSKDEQLALFEKWMDKSDLQMEREDIRGLLDQEYTQEKTPDEINYSALTTALRFCGVPDEELKELLTKKGFSEAEYSPLLTAAKKDLEEATEIFLGQKEWDTLSKNMGVKTEYPWEMKETSEVIEANMHSFIRGIGTAVFKPEMSDQERSWTAYCMTVALKQLGVSSEQRQQLMEEFAARNVVPNLGSILNDVENAETNFLRKPTWEKIAGSLQIKADYPWVIKETAILNKDKLQEAFDAFSLSKPADDLSKKDAVWTAEKYTQILQKLFDDSRIVIEKLKEWNQRANKLDDKDLPIDKLERKRNDDLDILRKKFGLKDMVHETVSNFAKVLHAAGLKSNEVRDMIHDWIERANVKISETKLEKILNATEKFCEDMKEWGRVPYVNKKDFQRLCKTLKIQAPWMWKNDRAYRKFQRDSSMNMAQGLWKSVWRGIEQERAQTEAKGEMLKQQLVREQVYRQQQSEERER